MDTKELCFSLSRVAGTSGDEAAAALFAKKLLSQYMDTKIDTLGNVVGTMGEGDFHILLDAHLDSIGLVVRGIDEKGFLLVERVGGPDLRVLTGAEVTVWGKEKLYGVICSVPPHLQKSDSSKEKLSIKQMAVDIGYDKKSAGELVEIGDRITVNCTEAELCSKNITSASFDDRSCVAAILKALELTKDKLGSFRLTVMFSAQEETGGSGAKTGAFGAMPDEAVAVDVGFGNDPYTDKTQTIELGKGPSIGISPTLDRNLTKELKAIAEKNNIPFQHDVMGGRTGTNADSINVAGCGVKTALLSLALRYMHTAQEIINTDDVENTAKLLACYLLRREAEMNA